MKCLFLIVITSFIHAGVFAQCPANKNTSVEIRTGIADSDVIIRFDKVYENIREIKVVKFGYGIVESAMIEKQNEKEYIISDLKSGEYMIQIIGDNCTSFVGTNKDYQGFKIK